MLLLDTHVVLWLVDTQDRIPEKALAGIEDRRNSLYVSAVSAWEIGMLSAHSRIGLPYPPSDFYARVLDEWNITELAIDGHIAFRAVALPAIHNDPFDRILIATAELNNLRIVTKDTIIPTYPGVRTLWN